MQYESNISSVSNSIIVKLNSLKQLDMMLREIASSVYANTIRRIHNKGQAVNGSDIGSYSTKPTLIGAKSFTTKGAAAKAFAQIKREQKAGTSKWVTVKGNRLAELQGGYKKIREIEGKAINVVNLNRTGKLQFDLKVEKQGRDYVIGFQTQYGTKLREYMEEHFSKKIYGLTAQDNKIALDIAMKYVKKQKNA